MKFWISLLPIAALVTGTELARAQTPGEPTGAPPPEAKAVVTTKAVVDAPTIKNKDDAQTATVSMGGMKTTGNANSMSGTASAAYDLRRDAHGFVASLLGNYSEGRAPGAGETHSTAENLQARARYEYYLTDRLSLFGMVTGRYDKFQGLDFRLNLDPGLKYIVYKDDKQSAWVEAGYDFQYDVRRDSARPVVDDKQVPVLGPDGQQKVLDKTFADHSARLFAGYKIAFNKEVTGSLGLEFLQGFRESDTGGRRSRLNFELLIAAKLFEGLSLGGGFTAKYDNHPMPGKENLDTATQAMLIYSFAEEKPAAPAPTP